MGIVLQKENLMVFLSLFLIAGAATPITSRVNSTPDTVQAYLDANSNQATAQAVVTTAQYDIDRIFNSSFSHYQSSSGVCERQQQRGNGGLPCPHGFLAGYRHTACLEYHRYHRCSLRSNLCHETSRGPDRVKIIRIFDSLPPTGRSALLTVAITLDEVMQKD